MRYRHELKFLLSARTAELLRARAKAAMRPDTHSGGTYEVCNVYFDDRRDSFYQEKALGSFQRDKLRLRWYNGDMSFLRLERKHKDGDLSYKDTTPLTRAQAESMLNGDFSFIGEGSPALLQTVAMIHRLRGLRPAAVFAYRREAFISGSVRLTFDGHPYPLGSEPRSDGFAYPGIADGYRRLLEVKYHEFLPEHLGKLLRGLSLARSEMSKYCLVRERGLHIYEPSARIAAGNAAG
ncbi:MAG: polyphosphate polymerase domain-containing protein [Oscillospiraceae bacterium]|nr:polyphosphate polymerase domain-containing protein [Oscillospiraceae bacterium]